MSETQTAEQIAIEKFVEPVNPLLADAGLDNGSLLIRSGIQYAKAGIALRSIREKRKALSIYFKNQPPTNPGPGEGLCWLTRRAWEAANSLFSKFDQILESNEDMLDSAMTKFRDEQHAKARELPTAPGESIRTVWQCEVTDLKAFIKAVAQGKAPIECLAPVPLKMRQLANAWGGQNAPAGVRFYQEEIRSMRKS